MKRACSVIFFTFLSSFVFCAGKIPASPAFVPGPQKLSSDYVSHIWTAADGLPGNAITDVIQSQSGYIYIGTYDGLVRFDGFDFTIFNKTTSSAFSFVSARSIFEDSTGTLWIGANDEGVEAIGDKKVRTYTTSNGLPNNSIRAFAEDRSHNIWVGTASGVVYISPDGGVHIPVGLEKYDGGKLLVLSLYCDTAGRIWLVSSNEHGLYYYTGGEFHRYEKLDQFGSYNPTAVGQDKDGAFWFGLGISGVARVDTDRIQLIRSGTVIDTSASDAIYLDHSGSLWFGTEKGLVLYRDGIYYQYTEDEGLSNNNIKRIVEDREGNIWLATDRGGIEKMNLAKFHMTKLDTAVNAIAEAPDERVWVGTDTGLRCYLHDIEETNILTKYCAGQRIRHVGLAKNGDVLVCCYAKPAQLRYGKEGIRSWTTDDGLAGNKIRIAVETSKGELYVGTTTGLSIIHTDGTITSYFREQGLSSNYIMAVYEDREGVIWVGTDGGGINLMKDGRITGTLTTENGLAGNVIFKINQDKDGRYWICTGTGITCYDRKEKIMKTFTVAEGLGSDSIFQMMFDYTGTVWMTSNRGISCASFSDFTAVMQNKRKTIDAKFFNQNDGLRSGGANSTSLGMCDSFGRLWFTLIDGFAVYDPVKARSDNVLPLVHLESVKLDEKENGDTVHEVVIPAGTKRIDIKYTGLSFISPERVRFKYQLAGFDSRYSDPVQNRVVSYTNLKPGKYTFSVMASNADGIWSTKPATLIFIQKPFFYQEPWFWLLCLLLLTGSVLALFRIRESANKKRQRVLEMMVHIKTIDLEAERDKSDRLLRSILPESIAERLKKTGGKTIADRYEETTVLFSDIVGFTDITAHASAEDVVTALNDLITRFDKRAEECGVEKIKTIGDAYMAACGVPVPNPDHAAVMLRFAEGMYQDLEEYNQTARIQFNIRIGVNSGPVIAGIIGRDKFIYDLWGDTVNVASRMQALCVPGEILVTDAVRMRVEKSLATIRFEHQTEYNVKGRGTMKTYVAIV